MLLPVLPSVLAFKSFGDTYPHHIPILYALKFNPVESFVQVTQNPFAARRAALGGAV